MTLNWSILDNKIKEAFNEIVEEFKQEQITQLESEKWQWPRETKRTNGSTVGSPRDIVDTGELLKSLDIENITSTEVIYHYPVPYAIIVHEGATLHTGTDIPARPWVDAATDELKDKLGN